MGQGFDLLGMVTRLVPERLVPEQPPSAIAGDSLRSVLVIKLSSIGDVVHALPVASALKRTYPHLRLTWAVESWTAPLVVGHPAIDRVVVFPSMVHRPDRVRRWTADFRAALRMLRAEPYDAVLDLQGLARSAALSLCARTTLRLARSGQREGAHLVSFGVPLAGDRLHAVEEYLGVAAAVGARPGPVTFALPVQDAAARSIDARLTAKRVLPGRPLIVVNPSATGIGKQWAAANWIEVIDALAGLGAVVIIGGSASASRHAELVACARRGPIDLTGQTTLAEAVALLRRAALHVAPDTGTVHIAAALGTPVTALYGPTRPWRVGPWQQQRGVIDHGDQCGRGCPAYCLSNRRCLVAATPGEVIAKARASLDSVAV